jgi:hypothetical protein
MVACQMPSTLGSLKGEPAATVYIPHAGICSMRPHEFFKSTDSIDRNGIILFLMCPEKIKSLEASKSLRPLHNPGITADKKDLIIAQ